MPPNDIRCSKTHEWIRLEDDLATVESVKAAVDLISPVDGKVVAVNGAVVENPDLISKDPYDSGWLVRVSLSDASQLKDLMTAQEYLAQVQTGSGE